MKPIHVAGFDPGLTGGAALLECPPGAPPTIVRTLRFRLVPGGGKRKLLDARTLDAWLRSEPTPHVAVIEQVAAMPKQGVSSTFGFGAATGALEAIVIASDILTVEWVSPAKWKRAMAVPADKRGAIDRAGLLFGAEAAAEHFPKLVHSGIAEAALVALWYVRNRLNLT